MWNAVGPDYFRTLRIPLLAGRAFDDRGDEKAAPVVMVNRTLAERFWGSAENAPGKRIRLADDDRRTVIGVAEDIKYMRIDESPRPYFYLPLFQSYRPTIVVYTAGLAPVETQLGSARAHAVTLDGDLPILYAKTLAGRMSGALMLFNLMAMMLFIFGVAGMALARPSSAHFSHAACGSAQSAPRSASSPRLVSAAFLAAYCSASPRPIRHRSPKPWR